MKRRTKMSSVLRAALLLALISPGSPVFALNQAQRDWYAARLADNARGRFDSVLTTPAIPGLVSEPFAETLVTWDRLRRDAYVPTFAEVSRFLRANPGWPQEMALRRKAERALTATEPFAERIAYFTAMPPLSATAKFRFAEALLASGRRAEAERLAREAWASDGLNAQVETDLLTRFGGILTPADHAARVDRLLWSGGITAAQRILPMVMQDRRRLAEARIALKGNAADAAEKLLIVPQPLANDAGLIADRVNWMRATGDSAGARQLLAATEIAPGSVADPERWMRLRLELARAAARDGQADLGYRIAAGHRTYAPAVDVSQRSFAERDVFTDLEYFAGSIALSQLGRPAQAVRHFVNYRGGAQSPLSQSRGDYWAGRAAAAAGQAAQARQFWEVAATHPDYFFGQLATERLGRPIALPPQRPIPVSAATRTRFDADHLVRAVRLLSELGDRPRQTLFLQALATRSGTVEEQRAMADLAREIGRRDLGVLVGREARNDGELALLDASYPRLPLSAEFASQSTMIHAITRQESRFDRSAISSAGARGLMQLMPGTARETAGKIGVPYDVERLFSDENYNVLLGSTYFQGLLDRWGGHHVLAVASYNAGPGNVNRWVRSNGDPRQPGVDIVDWIERIPFTETRIYVWRVLENAVVYDELDPARAKSPDAARLSWYLGKR
jgi:soluble lytic murein transglycosylase